MIDPIALAVPVFFLAIGAEWFVARRRGVRVYRLGDALTNLSCGVTSQLLGIFWVAAQLAIYAFVYERSRLVTFERAWIAWVVAFFAVDFLYYWWHRLSHEVNVLWAAHVTHHQSEDYNLAVALRQSVFTSWSSVPFYLPVALLGVPPTVFAIVLAASTLYQFWIHTELIGKLHGPVDWILNLPSHHRVHHAINPGYLDKNYGATLVVWDRLFGTYAEEIEPPVYGITKPLGTFDPLTAQVHYWGDMWAMARGAERLSDAVRVPFASPAWKPRGFASPAASELSTRRKYDRPLSAARARYVVLNYVLVLVVTFALLLLKGSLGTPVLVGASAAVLATIFVVGALLDDRPWARRAEVARLSFVLLLVLAALLGGCRRRSVEVRMVPLDGESAVLPALASEQAAKDAPSFTSASRTLDIGGVQRTWDLVTPAGVRAPLPLVLVLHGDGGSARSFHEAVPFERASGDGAVVAYLDGLHATWDLEAKEGENRDVAFASGVVAALAGEGLVDPARVFAFGYSSGGFFANVLACHAPGLLRAISSSAGGAPYNQASKWPNGFPKCTAQAPTAILALHGERDFGVRVDSGRFSASYWAYVNGCNEAEMEPTGVPPCTAYRGCPAGKGVAWCQIADLGHWVWDRAPAASWQFFLRSARGS